MCATAQFGIGHQRLRSLVGHPVAQCHFGQQRFQARVAVFGQERVQAPLWQPLQRAVHRFERAVQHAVAQLHGVFVLELLELVADRGTRLGADHELQPLRLGRGRARGDHFHGLPADQPGAQRYQFLVDPRGHRHVADVGVHRIGEVQRGGIPRQGEDLAFGREQVDLVREQVDLDVVEELQRRTGRALRVDQFDDPGMGTTLRTVGAVAAELVGPVRRHAALGDQVHFLGTDLHFDRRAVRAEQHRVQRLVAVGLGNGDEIAEASVQRLERGMHRAKCVVGVGHTAHDQAEPEHVHDLVEGFVLVAHLVVDAPRGLDPADQAVLQPFLGQPLRQLHLHLRHRFAAHHRLAADVLFQDRMAPRVQRLEAEVLQLALDQAHAQPLRDRGVDLQGFARDAAARFAALRTQGTHVVQAVGELDHDHAQVARHRQQHLAEALGGRFLAVAELQLVQLGDPVDQLGHRFAEFGGQLFAGQRGVFDGVVQDRGDQRFHVQAELGQHLGHGHRMGDVGLAGLAGLPGMRRCADFPGTAQQRQLLGRQVVGRAFKLEDIVGYGRAGRRGDLGRGAWVHGWKTIPAMGYRQTIAYRSVRLTTSEMQTARTRRAVRGQR